MFYGKLYENHNKTIVGADAGEVEAKELLLCGVQAEAREILIYLYGQRRLH